MSSAPPRNIALSRQAGLAAVWFSPTFLSKALVSLSCPRIQHKALAATGLTAACELFVVSRGFQLLGLGFILGRSSQRDTVLISNNFMKAQIWWMKQKSHILD